MAAIAASRATDARVQLARAGLDEEQAADAGEG